MDHQISALMAICAGNRVAKGEILTHGASGAQSVSYTRHLC